MINSHTIKRPSLFINFFSKEIIPIAFLFFVLIGCYSNTCIISSIITISIEEIAK